MLMVDILVHTQMISFTIECGFQLTRIIQALSVSDFLPHEGLNSLWSLAASPALCEREPISGDQDMSLRNSLVIVLPNTCVQLTQIR